MITHYPT